MRCVHSKQEVTPSVKIGANVIAKSVISDVVSKLDTSKLKINFKAKGNYQSLKSKIKTDRVFFKTYHNTNSIKAIDTASKYLYHKLIKEIVPHWYNRPWDFNGYTNKPDSGVIACGYFVSTTLKHLGFNLNRYKMAQQAGLNEAKALQVKAKLKIFRNVDFETLKQKINQVYVNGIYFVGLDNHVGYVLIQDQQLYFLHSSYCDNKVVIELAETSPCFVSNIYVFAEITSNRSLIEKWILNTALVIPI